MRNDHEAQVMAMGAIKCASVGSRVTCNPPPTDTDQDILVLVDELQPFALKACAAGFDLAGSAPVEHWLTTPTTLFASLTRGELNLICTETADFYNRFMAASSVAKRLNLMQKADRIALFQAVLYGAACDEVPT